MVAKEKWNDSGLTVKAGSGVRIHAEPGSKWIDWFIECGPDGYEKFWLNPFRWSRRVPDAPWFALICCIDRDLPSAFIVGSGTDCYIPPRDGTLFFFSNDAPFAYWNNKGQVKLQVTSLN